MQPVSGTKTYHKECTLFVPYSWVLTQYSERRILLRGACEARRQGSQWAPLFYFRHFYEEGHMKEFLLDERADMVERGLIMAAIVVAAVALWIGIGQKLAVKLGVVNNAIGG